MVHRKGGKLPVATAEIFEEEAEKYFFLFFLLGFVRMRMTGGCCDVREGRGDGLARYGDDVEYIQAEYQSEPSSMRGINN